MTIYQTLMNEIKQNAVRGAYAQPVPVGLQVTLNYSDKGILTKVVVSTETLKTQLSTNSLTPEYWNTNNLIVVE